MCCCLTEAHVFSPALFFFKIRSKPFPGSHILRCAIRFTSLSIWDKLSLSRSSDTGDSTIRYNKPSFASVCFNMLHAAPPHTIMPLTDKMLASHVPTRTWLHITQEIWTLVKGGTCRSYLSTIALFKISHYPTIPETTNKKLFSALWPLQKLGR